MKRSILAAALFGAAALFSPAAVHAASSVDFVAAGSSAQFVTFSHAAYDQNYTNHYSAKSAGSAGFTLHDPTAGVPNEPAQVFIQWKGSAGNYQIACYFQVDSTVGVRAFFNSDTLVIPSTLPSAAGQNVGYPGNGDVAPPAEVLTALQGAVVNAGATDITPEDAAVATRRCLALGYGSTNPIKSAISTTIATPVPFSLTARTNVTTSIGAVPIVVITNANNTSTGLSGPGHFTSVPGTSDDPQNNIDRFVLAGYLSGQFNRTSDLLLTKNVTSYPVHVYVREPLSGTYNTMEYCLAESQALNAFTNGTASFNFTATGGGQELGVDAHSYNPLNEPVSGSLVNPGAPTTSGRIRAIGTGELIKTLNADTTDSLGYAFWGTTQFSTLGNERYLTVDGADPIQDNYTGGSVTSPTVTFRNIYNGGYPIWSILRVVTQPQVSGSVINNIVTQAQNEDGGTDYASYKNLRVFRAYHATPFTPNLSPSNGNPGEPASAGGDVGGAVLSINADTNFATDFSVGGGLTGQRQ